MAGQVLDRPVRRVRLEDQADARREVRPAVERRDDAPEAPSGRVAGERVVPPAEAGSREVSRLPPLGMGPGWSRWDDPNRADRPGGGYRREEEVQDAVLLAEADPPVACTQRLCSHGAKHRHDLRALGDLRRRLRWTTHSIFEPRPRRQAQAQRSEEVTHPSMSRGK